METQARRRNTQRGDVKAAAEVGVGRPWPATPRPGGCHQELRLRTDWALPRGLEKGLTPRHLDLGFLASRIVREYSLLRSWHIATQL